MAPRVQGPARDRSVFLHATGVGPGVWDGVPAGVLGDTDKVSPANLGYPPRAPLPRGAAGGAADDAAAALDLLGDAGGVHLYGHSYGASVALDLAVRLGDRLRSLWLFEPVLFGALAADPTADPAALADVRTFTVEHGFLDDAVGGTDPWMERFIDYWNRPGSWSRMPEAQKVQLRAVGWKMYQEVRSCFYDVTDYGQRPIPAVPCTLVTAERTTAGARAMAHALAQRNPHARGVTLPGVGHMAPLTHPAVVHAALLDHGRFAGVPGIRLMG